MPDFKDEGEFSVYPDPEENQKLVNMKKNSNTPKKDWHLVWTQNGIKISDCHGHLIPRLYNMVVKSGSN